MSLYSLFKKVAFKIDPEVMHEFSMGMFSKFPHSLCQTFGGGLSSDSRYEVELGTLKWSFPIGLAAGLDKNAEAIDFFSQLGFGAIEVGTVTPKPQDGNAKPRLFRYPEEESLRNCMGFNNFGSEHIYQNIVSSERNGRLLGVNLGKNKVTSQEEAPLDYQMLYQKFAPIADYLVINVSSPNTPNLRDLQQKDGMEKILKALVAVREQRPCPLFIKTSPDATYEDLEGIIELASIYNLEGLIATNTTIMSERGQGGVSGKLLREKAREVRNFMLSKMPTELQFIGVGGVESIDDLIDFWQHGGKVMQIYSSFIYQGPEILKKFAHEIDQLFLKYDARNVEELIQKVRN